ncbi:MAG: PDZ domain-containing protein [Bdellovibrionales bacterium]|nr:PDZ domain-containing protein [Bdellovibrionales bacterium]MBT3525088.1 PDZ domain-containing protein [Bdellovibrionales bacterium]MBT7768109.1 PDZ domain-containing protein [Bdellovibrionales bacterium]
MEDSKNKSGSGQGSFAIACGDINWLGYLLILLVALAFLYVLFGWGRTNQEIVGNAGVAIETLQPPEIEGIIPANPPPTPAGVPAPEMEGVMVAPPNPGGMGQQVVFGFGRKTKIGATLIPIDIWHKQSLGLKNGDGALIYSVGWTTMASKAGLKSNDVIVRVNGSKVHSIKDFQEIEQTFVDGGRYRIRVIRGGRLKKINLIYRQSAAGVAANVQATQPQGPPWIGINVQKIDPVLIQQLKLESSNGVIVASVEPQSPADLANLAQEDVILEVNNSKIIGPTDLRVMFETIKVGDTITLSVYRKGKIFSTDVGVVAKPNPAKPQPNYLATPSIEVEASWLGATIFSLSRSNAKRLHLSDTTYGVLISAVAAGEALSAGLIVDDVIIGVNGTAVNGLTQFKKSVQQQTGVVLDVVRDGRHRYITLEAVKPHLLANITSTQKGGVTRVAMQLQNFKTVAVGSYGDSLLDQVYPYFENSPYFILYNPNSGNFSAVKNPAAGDPTGRKRYELVGFMLNQGVGSVVTGSVKPDLLSSYSAEGVDFYQGVFGSSNNVITLFLANKLIKSN